MCICAHARTHMYMGMCDTSVSLSVYACVHAHVYMCMSDTRMCLFVNACARARVHEHVDYKDSTQPLAASSWL